MDIVTGNVGWIEVICGPMFSGKSEELIRRLRRAMIARKRVQVFKPTIDTRYSSDEIVSHGDLRMRRPSLTVSERGFSTYTSLPALQASINMSACQ